MISVVTFFPLIGILFILLNGRENKGVIRTIAFATAVIDFLFSLRIYNGFNSGTANFQFTENISWIPTLGINYSVGIDGISLLLVMLTTFLTPIVILASWSAVEEKVKEYMIAMLILELGMIGVFVATDLFLFYVFWEVMLIPMYLLIGIWGGPRRIYAAVKFVLYTMVGSVLMLLAILYLYFMNYQQAGEYSFSLFDFYKLNIPIEVQPWLFLAFALAFAIKVPMFPFHTWLPDAHVEAPTGGSVILAGVLLKMGTYGFLRFCLPLFPNAAFKFMPYFCVLAIIGIIYGALVSMVQKDIKKLVAYSSVSHLGFVVLGIFAFNQQGMEGSIIQMINHGLSTGALFLLVGMIYERRHTRMIADFGGLAKTIPVFSTLFIIVALSSIGLPGLNGFIGEFLILVGTFQANRVYAAFAATGIILAAVYMLWMAQRFLFGEITHEENRKVSDVNFRELVVILPVIFFIILIGVYPQPFLEKMHASVQGLLGKVNVQYQFVEKEIPHLLKAGNKIKNVSLEENFRYGKEKKEQMLEL